MYILKERRRTSIQGHKHPVRNYQALVNLKTAMRFDSKKNCDCKPTERRPQYSTLIRISIGALHTDRMFLIKNRRRDSVMSASRAVAKVTVDRHRPMTVRY